MRSTLRRFEILLPHRFNNGQPIPDTLLADAVIEIREHFGAVSYQPRAVRGEWREGGIFYQDILAKVFVDVEDTAENQQWMKEFKNRWKLYDRRFQIPTLLKWTRIHFHENSSSVARKSATVPCPTLVNVSSVVFMMFSMYRSRGSSAMRLISTPA